MESCKSIEEEKRALDGGRSSIWRQQKRIERTEEKHKIQKTSKQK